MQPPFHQARAPQGRDQGPVLSCAFDAVCPHAGCTVEYDQSAAAIICPCHGSQFNAATGAVEVGPAATGLNPITIAKDSSGQLYAT
jgi:thiosulfate dehydrogenase [quinone] large subunit